MQRNGVNYRSSLIQSPSCGWLHKPDVSPVVLDADRQSPFSSAVSSYCNRATSSLAGGWRLQQPGVEAVDPTDADASVLHRRCHHDV